MTDKDTLIEGISGVTQIIQQRGNPDIDVAAVRPKVIRLLEEGLTFKQICALLIAVANEKDDDVTLGLRASNRTSLRDLDAIAERVGINADTPENRQRWEEKFKSGRAKYLCPKCGYAGNGEFTRGIGGDTHCFHCSFSGDTRYFTRAWTPEEQAAHEEQCRQEMAEYEQKHFNRLEQERRRSSLINRLRPDAVRVVKTLLEEAGDTFDDELCDTQIKWCIQIMSRPLQHRMPPIPPDELIETFRAELDPTVETYDQLEKVARRIDQMAGGQQ